MASIFCSCGVNRKHLTLSGPGFFWVPGPGGEGGGECPRPNHGIEKKLCMVVENHLTN